MSDGEQVVRKIYKQNKTTMVMEEVWIFQPDVTKQYSDFDCMEWILREFMGLEASKLPPDSDWHLIPQCITDMAEEQFTRGKDATPSSDN
tara:strand:+ start:166 stop:435 length:270 start_codon:yes stop_codon:yes gene_type:complete